MNHKGRRTGFLREEVEVKCLIYIQIFASTAIVGCSDGALLAASAISPAEMFWETLLADSIELRFGAGFWRMPSQKYKVVEYKLHQVCSVVIGLIRVLYD
ncbi:hypothetical protein AKJ16_DCAP19889 [Drosera capensis]